MAQTTYPSPYPAYTETYLTPDGYCQGNGNFNNMAYASGPNPIQPCSPFDGSQLIQHSDDIEVHRYNPIPAYNHVPTTSPPLYQPAVSNMGYGYQTPNMQTFCHAFGSDLSFYNTAGNSGMPQGFQAAMQGFPEAVAARKVVRKDISVSSSATPNETQTKKPQQRKRISCC